MDDLGVPLFLETPMYSSKIPISLAFIGTPDTKLLTILVPFRGCLLGASVKSFLGVTFPMDCCGKIVGFIPYPLDRVGGT